MRNQNDYTSYADKNKANDYLQLCKDAEYAFDMYNRNPSKLHTTSNGYTVVDIGENADKIKGSNFKAVLYQKGDEYVIAHFGTDVKSAKDLYADAKMALGGVPQQFTDALNFADRMSGSHMFSPQDLVLIGHSEGGAEAIYVKTHLGAKAAYTFNPYVPNDADLNINNTDNIYNFRTAGDIISKLGNSVGEDYIVEIKNEYHVRKGPMGWLDEHRLDSFGDCNNSLTPATYKQYINPNFKDKYKNEILSREDIKQIPAEIYDLAEDDVRFSISKYGIVGSTLEILECPITYPVSSYTRDDGTKVGGYIRRCGAKH